MNKKLLFMVPVLALSLLAGCSSNSRVVGIKPADDTPSAISEAEMETEKVRIHYQRADNSYTDWGVWCWRYKPNGKGFNIAFNEKDDFGAYCDIEVSAEANMAEPIGGAYMNAEILGFIIKTDIDDPTEFGNATRDPKTIGDRYIEIAETSPGGIQHVWLCENDAEVYETREASQKNKLLSGDFTTTKKFNVKVAFDSSTTTVAASQFHLYADGEEIPSTNYTYTIKGTDITVTLKSDADITKQYKVKIEFPDRECDLTLGIAVFYNTQSFKDNFTYYGDDLGVTFNATKTKTTFKLWAPVSNNVTLNIFNYGTAMQSFEEPVQALPSKRYQMRREQQGVWSITIPAYLHGYYYTYTVENGTLVNEVVDPYAKGCGINGKRGMIVDFEKINEEIGWDKIGWPNANLQANTDAVVYEAHVRDMTISETSGVPREEKGTFKGLARKGTKLHIDGQEYKDANGNSVTTGLDHVKELGITHIQLEPFYDYASTEETEVTRYEQELNYNWGYDPYNYNCLEGGYATDAHNGLTRIYEFKDMMKSFYDYDIGLIMDVVYNHTAKGPDSWFNLIVPGYYYRLLPDGAFYNDSGCGNTIATERPMVRKYIIESLKFWCQEYKISGFRFDLMGLIDTTTLSMAYTELEKIYDDVMMYGEPWPHGGQAESELGYQGAVSWLDGNRLASTIGVGGFNDQMRDAVRGGAWGGAQPGWVQGNTGANVGNIINGIRGTIYGDKPLDPYKVVNYVSCHDNYTLFDHIRLSTNGNPNAKMRNTQSDAFVMFAQGIPFIQEGEEFLRTKGDDHEVNHNSYNAGDFVNTMNWALKIENADVVKELQEQIALRKEYAGFRLDTRAKVDSSLKFSSETAGLISYTITHGGKTILVAHASSGNASINVSGYKLAYSNKANASASGTTYRLAANETVVFVK